MTTDRRQLWANGLASIPLRRSEVLAHRRRWLRVHRLEHPLLEGQRAVRACPVAVGWLVGVRITPRIE